MEELDTEESVQMDTRTYTLQYADAEDIAEQMNDLHSLNDSSNSRFGGIFFVNRPGSPPRTRFVPERRTNSLIAIARPNEFKSIEALLKGLDIPLDPDQVSPRIFRVEFLSLVCCLTLVGCATGVDNQSPARLTQYPSIESTIDPDWRSRVLQYRTFSVLPQNEIFEEALLMDELIEKHLLFTARNEFELLGYKYVDPSESPELIVTLDATNDYESTYVPPSTATRPR